MRFKEFFLSLTLRVPEEEGSGFKLTEFIRRCKQINGTDPPSSSLVAAPAPWVLRTNFPNLFQLFSRIPQRFSPFELSKIFSFKLAPTPGRQLAVFAKVNTKTRFRENLLLQMHKFKIYVDEASRA